VAVDWSEFTAEELAALHDWVMLCIVRWAGEADVEPPTYSELLRHCGVAEVPDPRCIAASGNGDDV